ncbi:MAG: hypothetical protein DLM56_02525 [Pseudonocardiales bacterium]|nr:MAG: hypothetical protein DLM56_02525 [Pseudonocardiales bacterium]
MDEDREPDYRFTLANERTFLAWIRTSLGLLAGGVGIVQLAPKLAVRGGREALGLLLIALSLMVSAGSVLRWRQIELAVRRGAALPRIRLTWVLAAGLSVVAVIVGVLILTGDLRR